MNTDLNNTIKDVLYTCIASNTLDEEQAAGYFSDEYTHTVCNNTVNKQAFLDYLKTIKSQITVQDFEILDCIGIENTVITNQRLTGKTKKGQHSIICEAMTIFSMDAHQKIQSTREVLQFIKGEDEYYKAKAG